MESKHLSWDPLADCFFNPISSSLLDWEEKPGITIIVIIIIIREAFHTQSS
jgi:hypothetical protein